VITQKTQVAPGHFVTLLEYTGNRMMLIITNDDGSPIDLAQAGYELRNTTWCQAALLHTATSTSFFVINSQFEYELSLNGNKVWSYRMPTNTGEFTPVSVFFFAVLSLHLSMNPFLESISGYYAGLLSPFSPCTA
jgi:hypothetical protein